MDPFLVWPCYWHTSTLFQTFFYMDFCIRMKLYHWTLLHNQLCSISLLYIFCGCYLYQSVPNFSDALITNPPYVYLGGSYNGKLSIQPEYNLLNYSWQSKFWALRLLILPTTDHPCLHRWFFCYMSIQGYLKTRGLISISRWNLDSTMNLVWL